ncbi:MAG: GNAT family N-acetyltransferase [Candidatus Fimivivens sp.]
MIRKFKVDDIDQIMKIWLDSNIDAHSFVAQAYWISNLSSVSAQILKADIYVYERDHKIVGFAGMQDQYLAGIFVQKEARSDGIGQILLAHIKSLCNTFSLSVYKDNKRAVNFYLREGLRITSEELDEDTNNVAYSMVWQT